MTPEAVDAAPVREPRAEGEAGEGGEGRRRSRDRYGRDRRERGDRAPREEGAAQAPEAAAPEQAEDASTESRRPRYSTGFVADEDVAPVAAAAAVVAVEPPAAVAAPVAAPVAPVAAAPAPATARAPAAAPAATGGLPKVQRFELPVAQLQQVAEGSGLQWVNSDAEKIAAVQAAIAAEPKPVRVPRERPPVVVIDEGPLVLVETRKDLGAMKLPFENANG